MSNLFRYHIAAGSYSVGKTRAVLMQAFLGTCVGVTIYDSDAGVGGLIHLLLPEPIFYESVSDPKKYASTGMPLFIQALMEAGASLKKLKACVAGGALLGPLNQQDLDLDIGGRTTEVVMNFLENSRIRCQKSETGGFFTCRLSLDMQNWQSRIEPSGYEKSFLNFDSHPPSTQHIKRTMNELQPIPQVALKILRIMEEDLFDIDKVAQEVQKDQVISAKTLKLCNSIFFKRLEKIDSIKNALILLGQNLLMKMILSASVKSFFNTDTMGYSLCRGGLYHHAVGTAIVAEKLAHFTGLVRPILAYTAGLLHDIGKVVLDQFITSTYPLFYRRLQDGEKNSLEVEKKILGIDHTEIGSQLARKWSFPDSLIETINHHHNPKNEIQHSELTAIVYLADLIMSRFHTNLEIERMDTTILTTQLEKIGLSTSQFPNIVDLIPSSVFESSLEPANGRGNF
ncbi:MAG: HDOD domain-containing protein [Desulfobacterales bacterium]|nr:HDOD domain-containing protein [Desulfobacterales bacterium]